MWMMFSAMSWSPPEMKILVPLILYLPPPSGKARVVAEVHLALEDGQPASRDDRCASEPRSLVRRPVRKDRPYFGMSISTMSELSRNRSKTMCLPSGVMSKVFSRPRLLSCESERVVLAARSSSQKSSEVFCGK